MSTILFLSYINQYSTYQQHFLQQYTHKADITAMATKEPTAIRSQNQTEK